MIFGTHDLLLHDWCLIAAVWLFVNATYADARAQQQPPGMVVRSRKDYQLGAEHRGGQCVLILVQGASCGRGQDITRFDEVAHAHVKHAGGAPPERFRRM